MSESEVEAVEASTPDAIRRNHLALAEHAKTALAKSGAVVTIGKGRHVCLKPLAEIAGLLRVTVICEAQPVAVDPITSKPMAVTLCRVSTPDGVVAQAYGYCSAAEKWREWHAIASMAETRAKVRALAQLLAPILTLADETLSLTPSETMPADMGPNFSANNESGNPAASGNPFETTATVKRFGHNKTGSSAKPTRATQAQAERLAGLAPEEYSVMKVLGMAKGRVDALIKYYEAQMSVA